MGRSDVIHFAEEVLMRQPDSNDRSIILLAGGEGLDDWEIDREFKQCVSVEGYTKQQQHRAELALRFATLVCLERNCLSGEQTVERLDWILSDFFYPKNMRRCSQYDKSPRQPGLPPLDSSLEWPFDALRDAIHMHAQELDVFDRL